MPVKLWNWIYDVMPFGEPFKSICVSTSTAPWLYVPGMSGWVFHLSTLHSSVLFVYFTSSITEGPHHPHNLLHTGKLIATQLGSGCEIVNMPCVLCIWEAPRDVFFFSINTHFVFPLKSVYLVPQEEKGQKWSGLIATNWLMLGTSLTSQIPWHFLVACRYPAEPPVGDLKCGG